MRVRISVDCDELGSVDVSEDSDYIRGSEAMLRVLLGKANDKIQRAYGLKEGK